MTQNAPESTQAAAMADPATLKALKRRTAVLAAIVAPAVILTVLLVVTQARAMRQGDMAEQAIPRTLVDGEQTWTSSSMKFSELEMEILETRDYMYRTYTDGRDGAVDLCIVFSEDNRKGTHPPDVCLEGSGSRIVARYERQVQVGRTTVPLRELVTLGPTGQYVYFAYVYKCGNVFTPSFYQQQVRIIWDGLTRRDASGALIRYSTPMANSSDLARARARSDQLVMVTFPYIRDRLNAAH